MSEKIFAVLGLVDCRFIVLPAGLVDWQRIMRPAGSDRMAVGAAFRRR